MKGSSQILAVLCNIVAVPEVAHRLAVIEQPVFLAHRQAKLLVGLHVFVHWPGALLVPLRLFLRRGQTQAGKLSVGIDGVQFHRVRGKIAVASMLGQPGAGSFVINAADLVPLIIHLQAVAVKIRVVKLPAQTKLGVRLQQHGPLGA